MIDRLKDNAALFLGAVPFFILFIFAGIFPEQLWGISWFVCLSFEQAIGSIGFSLVLIILVRLSPRLQGQTSELIKVMVLIMIATSASVCHYILSIVQDEYGNAFQYREFAQIKQVAFPDDAIEDVFSISITPSTGRKTVLGTYTIVSYLTGLDYGNIFKWSGLIFGFIYSISWVVLIRSIGLSFTTTWVMAAVGCFAAPSFVFYDHLEIYAPVISGMMVWLLLFHRYSKTGSSKILVFLLLLTLVNIRMHPLNLFLLIPLGIMLGQMSTNWFREQRIDWLWTLKWIHLPVWLLGSICYFFIFQDHIDPRYLNDVQDHERIFLPLISPDAPLDRYNLLSLNHILDFFNVLLLWVIPGVGVLMGSMFSLKARPNHSNEFILLVTVFLLSGSFLFMVNPLLSMPMDLDLFLLPGVLVLPITAFALKGISLRNSWLSLSASLVLTILIASMFVVNSNKEQLSARLEMVGKRIFKTYYLHSSRVMISGIGLSDNRENYIERKKAIVDELRPYALPGNDPKFANLLYDDAMYYLKVENDTLKARSRFEEAVGFNPELSMEADGIFSEYEDISYGLKLLREEGNLDQAKIVFKKLYENEPDDLQPLVYLMEAEFLAKDHLEAYRISRFLLSEKYPTELIALKRTIHCALEAELRDSVISHAAQYLTIDPIDPTINKIGIGLKNHLPLNELKELFRSRSDS